MKLTKHLILRILISRTETNVMLTFKIVLNSARDVKLVMTRLLKRQEKCFSNIKYLNPDKMPLNPCYNVIAAKTKRTKTHVIILRYMWIVEFLNFYTKDLLGREARLQYLNTLLV